MVDGSTDVSVLSLEDFKSTLQHRLEDVDAMLRQLDDLGSSGLRLGTFQDATESTSSYEWIHSQYVSRIQRLRDAIVAAQIATTEIIASYRTTEARNQADAADIAQRLGNVTSLLGSVVGSVVGAVIGGLSHAE
jgi:hypothetical protein